MNLFDEELKDLPESDDEEEDKTNEDENKQQPDFVYCGIYELFNHLPFIWTKVFIDIRPTKQFEENAINEFVNLPYDLLDTIDCDEKMIATLQQLKKQKLGEKIETIICISNKEIMDNKKDMEFFKYLKKLISDTFDINISITIVDTGFDTFFKQFPFLCGKKEDMLYYLRRYPSQIINDKLFLGNKTVATTKKILMDLNINYIVNMTQQMTCQQFDVDQDLKIKYLHCPIWDDEAEQIGKYFEKGIDFIDKALNNDGRVLVHCQAGVSRSSTMIIAYLMKIKKLSFKEAYKYTLKRREIIEPNDGFIQQLKLYEKNMALL